ncbi:MAG: hypothetical protein AAFX06_21925 [Planctomycetota bacterium]
MAIVGLAKLRVSLVNCEQVVRTEPEQAANLLKQALEELLNDQLLGKLFAHVEIIGALTVMQRSLESSECNSDFVSRCVQSIRSILVDYL